ncbi:uncharacterized protein [Vicugna pacos]|uniref:Uncharacterized protein isoform X2 n=1 Tax=Vicugna pacos TaxID=30538 RepID=A0ABM5BZ02_VICPA
MGVHSRFPHQAAQEPPALPFQTVKRQFNGNMQNSRSFLSKVSTQACAQEVLSETSVPLDPPKEATYLQPQPTEIQLKGESQDPQHQQDCEYVTRIDKELIQKQELAVAMKSQEKLSHQINEEVPECGEIQEYER